jgi:hypothetical protein
MASRNWDADSVLGKRRRRLDITFFPQGAGAPVVNAAQARGVASITRTGVGAFLITLEDAYRSLVSKSATVQLAAAADVTAQFGVIANVGTALPPTIEVRLLAAAAAVEVAANANNSISVQLGFNDTDVF